MPEKILLICIVKVLHRAVVGSVNVQSREIIGPPLPEIMYTGNIKFYKTLQRINNYYIKLVKQK